MNDFDLDRRPVHLAGEVEGGSYHLSSHDLRRGLEVRAVPLNAMAPELLREFLRLRRLWGSAALPGAH